MSEMRFRKSVKRLYCICVCSISVIFMWLNSFIDLNASDLEENSLYGKGVVLMDADSKRVLYEKNGDEPLAMASTTKIMTCIMALELGNSEEMVEYTAYAKSMPKVKMDAVIGEHFKMEDLLKAMMLESYNDIATAVAEHIGKKLSENGEAYTSKEYVDLFVGCMNEKAKEIGCEDTYFATPNGLDNLEVSEIQHHTTARDLALIMAYCVEDSVKKDEFLKITQTDSITFKADDGRSYNAQNKNRLLNMRKEAESGKTGFTNKAGYCYVFSFREGEKHFTCAILACGWPGNKNYKWQDAKKVMEYGMDSYDQYSLGEIIRVPEINNTKVHDGCLLEKGEDVCLHTELKNMFDPGDKIMLNQDDKIVIKKKIKQDLVAPVKKGEMIGTIDYYLEEKRVAQIQIVSDENIDKRNAVWSISTVLMYFLP